MTSTLAAIRRLQRSAIRDDLRAIGYAPAWIVRPAYIVRLERAGVVRREVLYCGGWSEVVLVKGVEA